jgi:hypothetical protein
VDNLHAAAHIALFLVGLHIAGVIFAGMEARLSRAAARWGGELTDPWTFKRFPAPHAGE